MRMRLVHALAALPLLLTARAPTTALAAGGRCDGFSGTCATKGTRTSCANHDGCYWSSLFDQCEGVAAPCASYKSQYSCEGSNSGGRRCEWTEDGVPSGPTLPPSPMPTGSPTTRCDAPLEVREYPDSSAPPMGTTFVDLNGDGRLDRLGTVRSDDGDYVVVVWHEATPEGGYVKRVLDAENGDVTGLAAADLDGDGNVDVAYTEAGSRCCSYPDIEHVHWGSVGWYRGLGGGEFEGRAELSERNVRGAGFIQVGDVDGDSLPDLVLKYENDSGGIITWFKNFGGGSFSERMDPSEENGWKSWRTIGNRLGQMSSMEVGDANGDGTLDILVSLGVNYHKTILYTGAGDGTFVEAEVASGSDSSQRSMFADVDSDGRVDIVGSADGGVLWYQNKGGGSYEGHRVAISRKGADGATVRGGGEMAVADLNRDGLLDFVQEGHCSTRLDDGCEEGQDEWVIWFENKGNGVFVDRVIAVPEGSWSFHSVDLDDDGYLDLARESYWIKALDECFVGGSSEPEGAAAPPPGPDPTPAATLALYPYTREFSSSSGWLSYPPEKEDGSTLDFDASSAEECASKCEEENAPSGSWYRQTGYCVCYFVTAGGMCREPCVEEEGVDFSTFPLDVGYCADSFCSEDWFGTTWPEYCDETHAFDQVECDAKIQSLNDPTKVKSSTSALSLPTKTVLIAIFVHTLYGHLV